MNRRACKAEAVRQGSESYAVRALESSCAARQKRNMENNRGRVVADCVARQSDCRVRNIGHRAIGSHIDDVAAILAISTSLSWCGWRRS